MHSLAVLIPLVWMMAGGAAVLIAMMRRITEFEGVDDIGLVLVIMVGVLLGGISLYSVLRRRDGDYL